MGMDRLEAGAPDGVDRHVGARIRQRRRELGVSQQQLAERIGVTFQQVQKYEAGTNRVSASKLWRIGHALAAGPAYWFDGLPTDATEASLYDDTAQLILTEDGRELARAYTRIPGRSARQALIAIARELSGPGPGPMDRAAMPGSEGAAAKAPD